MTDKDKEDVQAWLEEIIKDPENYKMFYSDSEQRLLAGNALKMLTEPDGTEARLLTAKEVRELTAGTPVVVERLIPDAERYLTMKCWGVCSVTGKIIVPYDRILFPDTVQQIPYKTIGTNKSTGKSETHMYRFWTAKPTEQQSAAVKWK